MTPEKIKFIDLDAFIPEPLTMKVNGQVYPVQEVTTEIYLRILKLSELEDEPFEEAKDHFISIFKTAVPTLPDEIIANMNGAQIQGFLQFLIQSYAEGKTDPNVQKPMLKVSSS